MHVCRSLKKYLNTFMSIYEKKNNNRWELPYRDKGSST